MKTHCLLSLVLLWVVSQFGAKLAAQETCQTANEIKQKIASEIKDAGLDGNWKVEATEFQGHAAPANSGAHQSLIIEEGVMKTFENGESIPHFSNLRLVLGAKLSAGKSEFDIVRGVG